MLPRYIKTLLVVALWMVSVTVGWAQPLDKLHQSIIPIAAYAAQGNLQALKTALHNGLDNGLTVNQTKEILIHLYAYCGFPRSIRGLQTLMEVLEARKARGITDLAGAEASPVAVPVSKYERGRQNLAKLTNASPDTPPRDYALFAPVIDTLLKEHLFADLFDRDVLTYAQRQLVTVSVLSTIGKAEPMLRSHFRICLNVGISPEQLREFTTLIQPVIGKKAAQSVRSLLNEVLQNTP
ncbi:carboxymuconolactone decarboxylase family protein [Rhodoflexus caldus]|uniref:carboxymuconolactone decarboxylase family protein n=1 Tax=Rhodoflexus caldus TaxID=2891236 RepID=UPI00202A3513|nr:carboxymuconolactone decarboxylase family protein [Rhodoflexus caldus]